MVKADNDKPIYLVCGFGRCGSSLMMQMLNAGGIPATGTHPSFEDDHANAAEFDSAWLAQQGSRAVKVLDPHRETVKLPPADYRVIWMDRDTNEQAKSHGKFLKVVMGLNLDRAQRRRFEGSLIADRSKAFRRLNGITNYPILVMPFERVIENPARSAEEIATWVGDPVLDQEAMVRCVLPRSSKAQPDMSIEISLIEGATERGGYR